MTRWARLLCNFGLGGWLLLALQAEEPAHPKGLPPDERMALDALVRWIERIGGEAELRDLRTAFIKSRIDFGNGGPPLELLVRGAPDGYRIEYNLPAFGQLVQAYDGRVAWQYNERLGFGFQSMHEHQLNSIMTDFRAPLRTGRLYPQRKALPKETLDGRELLPVQMTAHDGRVEKWYFEPATGYRVRMELPGDTEPTVVLFEDFRQAFGARVQEPYRVTRIEQGRRVVVSVDLILYNESMDQGLFAPPLMAVEDNERLQLLLSRNAAARGAQVLDRVQTRVTEQTELVTTSGQRIPTKVYQKRPNLIAIVQEVPGMGQVWRGYDGRIGWAWSEIEGYREMQGAELQQMIQSADLEGPLKLSARCPFRKLLGETMENGRNLLGVAMASLQGPEGNFYFDTQNGDLLRVETFMLTGADGILKVTADFSDYRHVDGMLFPFTTVITNPAVRVVVQVQNVQHNVPIDDAVFAPKRE